MNKTLSVQLLPGILLLLLILPGHCYAESQSRTIEIASGEEISFEVYGNNVKQRIIWVSPNYGVQERHIQTAEKLARSGMQVWFVNLTESLFMPGGAEYMRKIPGEVIADLIEKVSEQGTYKVVIISSGYGGIPVLKGINSWQQREDKSARLGGTILFSPYFYTHVPELGNTPTFENIIHATNVPIYIFQAEKNSNRAYIQDVINSLQKNAPVSLELMKGSTFVFYEEDKAPETYNTLKKLPGKIKRAIKFLENYPMPAVALDIPVQKQEIKQSGLNVELRKYMGEVVPKPFSLKDISGKVYTVNNFKGKVSLINFWASWCKPCIEEIPSLNSLKIKMQGKPFQLISVNFAEKPERIKSFMSKVKVDFPVLLDKEGNLSGKWKVVAFPSTFVVGMDGKIQYGVNAAIHWDTDQVIKKLESLMK